MPNRDFDPRAFAIDAAAAIRSQDFKRATAFFLRAMKGSPFFAPARKIAGAYIGLTGWEAISGALVRFDAKGVRITALGLNITGHNEGPDPMLEIAFYDDGSFPFSRGLDDLRRACDVDPHPWQGCFIDVGGLMTVRGMNALYGLIASYPHRYEPARPGAAPKDYDGFSAALWYLYFRIHHAVARDAGKAGLPFAMPVVVGEHDFGPSFTGAYPAIASGKRLGEGEKAERERAKRALAAYDRHTEEMIAELKRNRAELKNWRESPGDDKRANYAAFIEVKEANRLSILELPKLKPSWRMDEAEFRRLIDAVRAAREARKRRAA